MLVRWETSRSTVKPSSGDIWVMTVRTPMAWSTTAWGGEGLLQLPVFSAQPLHLRAQPGGPRWRVSHRGGWGKPCVHPGKQRVAVIFIACPNIVFGTRFAAPDTAERAPGPQPGGRTRGLGSGPPAPAPGTRAGMLMRKGSGVRVRTRRGADRSGPARGSRIRRGRMFMARCRTQRPAAVSVTRQAEADVRRAVQGAYGGPVPASA